MYTAHATHAHRRPRAAGRSRRGVGGEIERFTVGERRAASKELVEVLADPPERPGVLVRSTGPTTSRMAHARGLVPCLAARPEGENRAIFAGRAPNRIERTCRSAFAGPPERLGVFVRPTGPPLSRSGHAHGLILVARRGVEDEYLSKKWRRQADRCNSVP